MRIAADLNYTCPYTGKTFDDWDIRSKTVDLDHILPRSQRATDAMDALVLTFKAVNDEKKARTARQFIRDCGGKTIQSPGFNGQIITLQIRTEEQYLAAIDKLRCASSVPNEKKTFKQRIDKLKMLSVDEAEGMTQGMLTQTSAIAKLAHRAILGLFKGHGCKPIRPILIPGRITKEVRSEYDLLGMLAQFDARLIQTSDENGVQKTSVVHKGDMRNLTHMHHAVDAIAILLAGTLITPQNRVWDLIAERRLNAAEKDFLLQNGPFAWDSHDHLTLQRLAPDVERSIRAALGELRTVRYASKRLGRTVLEETQWRIEKIEGNRAFLSQGHGDNKKRPRGGSVALSAIYGLEPPSGNGKLLRNNAVYQIGENYAIALTASPKLIRNCFVWRELQALAAKNNGKVPRLLRRGDLVEVPSGEHKGLWRVDSVKESKQKGVIVDLSYSYNANDEDDSRCRWREVTIARLQKAGATFPRYRLTGIPACPITSLKSPDSKKRNSTPKTDSSTAE